MDLFALPEHAAFLAKDELWKQACLANPPVQATIDAARATADALLPALRAAILVADPDNEYV